MWPRTEAGPQGDGDALHKEWVKKVEAAVGDAAVGLYVNEVSWHGISHKESKSV
jgi:hypothetical protein